MAAVEIKPNIYWIGVNDRTTDLFEGLWPISRDGVSYNSYLIKDKKNAIIDLSKAIKTDVFFDHIAEVIDISQIDYVILNHMEPDHTGVLRTLKKLAPDLTILCTEKAKTMLKDYYAITTNIEVIREGMSLSLGNKELKFFETPFVHWPETMVTFETSQNILFSCDAFGGYGAFRGTIFDDQCKDLDFYINESLRYYVNIVAKFSRPTLNAIEKLKRVPVEIIAPSHGLIWRKQPGLIVELYKKWAGYATEEAEKGITLIYGSMYGNTEMMMNSVALGLSHGGVPVDIFDAARTHPSYILPSLWTKSAVVIGAPTYEVGLFPPVAQILEMAALKRVLNKKAAMFGSFGWSGGALRAIKNIIEPLKWDLADIFEFRGGPTPEDLKKGHKFGVEFAKKVLSFKKLTA